MMHTRKVCHLTTVHSRSDTRIFLKECRTLAKNGYNVQLIVADGKGDDEVESVKIYDLGLPKSRMERILFFSRKGLKKAIALNAEIYHFHDPELLRVGSKLAIRGKKVIYDAHEDVPRQILSKAYIPLVFRKTISATFERFENRICSKLSGIVTSTPFIKMRFSKINNAVTEVQNFPFIEEFSKDDSATVESPQDYVCYVGAISKVRGILNIVKAMAFVENAKLLLAGKFETEELRDNAIRTEGWDKVVELGFVDREEVKKTLQKSTAGLVVLEPTINYLDSIPIKMFEYMAAGIPVIASNFKYWKDLIKEENCALFVDPIDPDNIAEAISTLMKDKDRAKAMGENGRNAVLEKFNWSREEEKLLAFYGRLGN